MALINNIYVLCEDENITTSVDLTSHPTESGIPITDSVRKKPIELAIKGKIVSYKNMTAKNIIDKLNILKNQGSLIDFQGINSLSNLQIATFNYSNTYKIHGGADFTMELVEYRAAKSSYTSTTSKNVKLSDLKIGSTVVFKGGLVYVSSDATKPAATRNKSTCKVTRINQRSWALRHYHLQSMDGGKVFGWVDDEDIQTQSSASTSSITNGGKQKITVVNTSTITHVVKKGDTVWDLVIEKYKVPNITISSVIKNNPSCFSRKGDATTLQIGSRLVIEK